MAGEAVLGQRRLAVGELHGDGRDDVDLDIIGKLGEVDIVGVVGDLEARPLHGARDILADAHLGLRARRVGVCGDGTQVLAEGVAAGQFEEAGLAGELRGGAGSGEAGEGRVLGEGSWGKGSWGARSAMVGVGAMVAAARASVGSSRAAVRVRVGRVGMVDGALRWLTDPDAGADFRHDSRKRPAALQAVHG